MSGPNRREDKNHDRQTPSIIHGEFRIWNHSPFVLYKTNEHTWKICEPKYRVTFHAPECKSYRTVRIKNCTVKIVYVHLLYFLLPVPRARNTSTDDYGSEAVYTSLKVMEDYRDDLYYIMNVHFLL